MFQEISHNSFHNSGKRVDRDVRGRYMSHTSPSTSNNTGKLGRSLGIYFHGHERSGHMYQTIQLTSYNHGVIYIFHPHHYYHLFFCYEDVREHK